ncbi:MAG: trimethylamine methyltransferase family protein [Pseudomonadota bacterium]
MSGGRYLPLTRPEIEKIHRAALDVLEQVGLADTIQTGIDVMTAAGAVLRDNGRLTFPRALVEDTIAKDRRARDFDVLRVRAPAALQPVLRRAGGFQPRPA